MSIEGGGMGKARTQAVVLIVLVFLAGAFAGGATERFMHRRGPGGGAGQGRPGGGFGFGERGERGQRGERGGGGGRGGPRSGLPPYYNNLGLSDTQRAKIDTILTKRRARIDSVMKSTMSLVQPAMDSTREEVNAVLTVDQRAKLDSARARGRARQSGRGGPDSTGRRR